MRPRFTQTDYDYYPMEGGLDIQTPAIALSPGKCIDAQNYVPATSGGYRRVKGFERFDGRASPTSASYWVIDIAQTGTITNGVTITGLTSSATGIVLGVYGTTLVLGRVSGTFNPSEALQIAAVTVATSTGPISENGASAPADDADYSLLAANDLRSLIQAVPGSGMVRGVWVYDGDVYAFRDNAGGTAGGMYMSTSGGWSQVNFGTEIQFSSATGGTTPIAVGATIGNSGTPTKTATVLAVLTRTGTWGTDAVGTLIITPLMGSFSNADQIWVGGTQKGVATSGATAITRAPGGTLEFVVANFTGSTATSKLYGVDGVNLAFEFDGTNYIPIRTGMAVDTPTHVIEHKNHLMLSYLGSLQVSGIGQPYSWTVLTGAAEISTGASISGLLTQTGNSSGASLAIFTTGKTFILYGSSTADFNLVPSVYDLGYSARTMQPVGNNTYGVTAMGIQSLITTLNYGDFEFAAISFLIESLMASKRGKEVASTVSLQRNEYRLYWNDGTGIAIGLTGAKVSGILPINYGIVVRCIGTHRLSDGSEVTYFGSDDGYVYQDNIGTSFDGEAIEAWIRPAFNNLKSPRTRKQYRRAVFEVEADGYCEVNVTYDLDYASPDVSASVAEPEIPLAGASYWDQATWDRFNWDTSTISQPSISIDGIEKNISFLFYSNRAQDEAHVIQGVTLLYTPRLLQRGG